MAAPNIVNVANIVGKTTSLTLSSTSAFSVANNASASGTVWKINTLVISNFGSSSANVAVHAHSAAALGGTPIPMANNLSIPVGASIILVDKSTSIYLEEDRSIGATAATGNTLSVHCSYEIIS